MLDRAISMKFLTHRVSLQVTHSNFQNIFVSPIMAAMLNFRIAIHKNAYISKSVLDRVILTTFITHRVSLRSSHPNFQKVFVSPNIAAIFNFPIFRKNCKTQKSYLLKTVLYRASLTYRASLQNSHLDLAITTV